MESSEERMSQIEERPTYECPSCKTKLILCWGEKTVPYLRHEKGHGGDSCDIRGYQETVFFLTAKALLKDFLLKGGRIEFSNKETQSSRTIPSEGNFVQEDAAYDLTILDGAAQPIFGIDFLHRRSRKASSSRSERKVSWVELSPDEVLACFSPNILHTTDPSSTVSIVDHRTEADLSTLAVRLGYYREVKPYPCLSRQLLDEAIRGSFRLPSFKWTKHPKTVLPEWEAKRLRGIFLEKKQCLRCKSPTETTTMSPYCDSCKQFVFDQHLDFPTETSNRKDPLRRILKPWLDGLENGEGKTDSCAECNRSPYLASSPEEEARYRDEVTGSIHTTTWWFGKHKRLCTSCLDKGCRDRGLV